jgi:hypothetical protein
VWHYTDHALFPPLSVGTAYTGYGVANSVIVWYSRGLNRAEICAFGLCEGPLRARRKLIN